MDSKSLKINFQDMLRPLSFQVCSRVHIGTESPSRRCFFLSRGLQPSASNSTRDPHSEFCSWGHSRDPRIEQWSLELFGTTPTIHTPSCVLHRRDVPSIDRAVTPHVRFRCRCLTLETVRALVSSARKARARDTQQWHHNTIKRSHSPRKCLMKPDAITVVVTTIRFRV